MIAKKSGLGKGLDTLIPNNQFNKSISKEKEEVDMMISINKVEPNREQPRKNFEEDALLELSESIKQFGVIQPILVQKKDDYYEIVAGERRWRASKMAGLREVPVIIREFTKEEAVEISLIENIQRENLNPIEEAMAYKRLLEEFSLKQDEVAERVSKSRTAVTNSMRLLRLSEKVQQMVVDELISTGHARALLSIEDENQQCELAERIFDESLSVRDVEKLMKSMKKAGKKKTSEIEHTFLYEEIEERLKSAIGTKVTVNPRKNGKGKIEIEYYSPADLDRIYELLMSAK